MRYLLLVKLPQDPESLNNTDGWQIIATTPYDERSVEWEEQYTELKETGEVEDFHIVTLEQPDMTTYRVKGGVTRI